MLGVYMCINMEILMRLDVDGSLMEIWIKF